MEPKYALSQGDVKKKKHKITINPQKKSPLGGAIPGKWHRGGRGTLFRKFGEGRPGGDGNGREFGC
jgi:hypothetical protein